MAHQIVLTDTETMIFTLLRQTVATYSTHTILRVVGGWVRDKLLGRESHDIDITVDNMPSYDFSVYLQKYIQENTTHQISGIGVIQPNPSSGKHLLTSTLRIDNIPIDICCLRPENFGSDSTGVGTPLSDARRRDFTINSLFYRVNDGVIEDMTQQGLSDLSAHVIRTPIPPQETLVDDPLRALRAIRFSAKMCYTIDPHLIEVMKSDTLKIGICSTISRERIGNEILGMIQTGHQSYCFEKLMEVGYYTVIFGECDEVQVLSVMKSYEELSKAFTIFNEEHRVYGAIASATFWFIGMNDLKNMKVPRVQGIIMEALKLSTAIKNNVALIHSGYLEVKKLDFQQNYTRLDLGRIVLSAEALWREAICLYAAIKSPITVKYEKSDDGGQVEKKTVQWVGNIIQKIEQNGLENCYKMRPKINGDEIAKILGRKKGPWLKEILRGVIEMQIERPEATHNDILDYVKNWK
ncbi:polyA polymerase, putative [Entamoeba invadens IP1]|uniref:PolyA polymerase, putative n=1 Tax=Entamoeba invadens IP1 TaxID=370355 RepID=L7FJG6_ENTIV|nr:polyA polymerase, putative [Entamoeba invadens IP1]ELP84001.1 polyA polymerase, putative [Entamoeba invadens IP1]|eukprot:XP_004183347.1 polyA polymerase, putative [Entamoeba invadens IP1]